MDFSSTDLAFALLLTFIAGLSTGIGSAIAYFIKKPKMIYLSFSLGLSAGVMIYVSFAELLVLAVENVGEDWAVLSFFVGILFIGVIDFLVPEADNPHELKGLPEKEGDALPITEDMIPGTGSEADRKALMRTGMFTALAIGIHNFPEGLATFATALENPGLGVFIAFAIAIHNIPEGISASMPIYYATGDRKLAFKYSFLSGVAEPVGAVLGFLILLPFLDSYPGLLDGLLAFVAGIMIYISLDELLPMAHRYGHNHTVILGVVTGMFIMAVSLLML